MWGELGQDHLDSALEDVLFRGKTFFYNRFARGTAEKGRGGKNHEWTRINTNGAKEQGKQLSTKYAKEAKKEQMINRKDRKEWEQGEETEK